MNSSYPSKDFISLFSNGNTSLSCWATASLSLWDTLSSAYTRRIGRGERKQKNAKAQCFSIFLLVYERWCGEREVGVCRVSSSSRIPRIFKTNPLENGFAFVKKVLKENGNCGLALRKRLFCDAKQPLLPCKTYAFGTQNNRFYKALIASELCKTLACEKYLRNYGQWKAHGIETECVRKARLWAICPFAADAALRSVGNTTLLQIRFYSSGI